MNTFTVKGPGAVKKDIAEDTCGLTDCLNNLGGRCILKPKPVEEDKHNICISYTK